MQRTNRGLKKSHVFCLKTALPPKQQSGGKIAASGPSKKTKQNSFSRIRFTTATFATRVKCMRGSIRRLSPKSFLTECKKFLPCAAKCRNRPNNHRHFADCCREERAVVQSLARRNLNIKKMET